MVGQPPQPLVRGEPALLPARSPCTGRAAWPGPGPRCRPPGRRSRRVASTDAAPRRWSSGLGPDGPQEPYLLLPAQDLLPFRLPGRALHPPAAHGVPGGAPPSHEPASSRLTVAAPSCWRLRLAGPHACSPPRVPELGRPGRRSRCTGPSRSGQRRWGPSSPPFPGRLLPRNSREILQRPHGHAGSLAEPLVAPERRDVGCSRSSARVVRGGCFHFTTLSAKGNVLTVRKSFAA